ncbi:MAG: transketolase [Bacteroidetes bacterium]|nr:transketolase [Bacteroidota bacterium]
MRKTFSIHIEKILSEDEKVVFITGDLGFNALENLQNKFPKQFINAGVAEQNMISMAAGMAYKGYKVFCYSIAPFIVYRCLEQFRNDVCFHNLPVFIVGNGGGYGYGIMGSSHHAIEDIACLSGLPNNTCWVPAFTGDVRSILNAIIKNSRPAYLRLGLGNENPFDNKYYGSFNVLLFNQKAEVTIVAMGPVVDNAIKAIQQNNIQNRVNLLTCNSLPLEFTTEVESLFSSTGKLVVVEEHVSVGGLAQQLSVEILKKGIQLKVFKSLCAKGYLSKRYGDQGFHQKESGLDIENISTVLKEIIND